MTEFTLKDSIFIENKDELEEEIRALIRECGYDVRQEVGELVFTLSGKSWNRREIDKIFFCMEEVGRKNEDAKRSLRIFEHDLLNHIPKDILSYIFNKANIHNHSIYFVMSDHNLDIFQEELETWREQIEGVEIISEEMCQIPLIENMDDELTKKIKMLLEWNLKVFIRICENKNTLACLPRILSTIQKNGLGSYDNFLFQLVEGEMESRIYYIIGEDGKIYPYPERKGLTEYGIGTYYPEFFVEALGNSPHWIMKHPLTCAY